MDETQAAGQLAPRGYADEAEIPKQQSQRDRLNSKKRRLEAQLAVVTAALGALDEHPELERFIDLMGRAL